MDSLGIRNTCEITQHQTQCKEVSCSKVLFRAIIKTYRTISKTSRSTKAKGKNHQEVSVTTHTSSLMISSLKCFTFNFILLLFLLSKLFLLVEPNVAKLLVRFRRVACVGAKPVKALSQLAVLACESRAVVTELPALRPNMLQVLLPFMLLGFSNIQNHISSLQHLKFET